MRTKCPKQLGYFPREEDHQYAPCLEIKPHPKMCGKVLRTHWHTQNA
jgi:hypothetical protein